MRLIDRYLRDGYALIPINRRSKAPSFEGWQEIHGGDLAHEINGNVGVVLHNSNLVDVDVDCPEALDLVPHFLPTTATFGRASSPRSHWIYRGLFKSKRYQDKDSTLIELRCSGAQTVFPPSIHESGESIEWCGEPSPIDAPDNLPEIVGVVAAAALIVRHAPPVGSRHDLALSLGGALARMGWDAEMIESFVRPVFVVAQFRDLETHVRSACGSVSRHNNGEHTTGWTKAASILGPTIVKSARQWLGDDGSASGRVQIPLSIDKTEQINRTIKAISKQEIYQKAGTLVQICRDPSNRDNAQIQRVELPRLEELVDQTVQFVGTDKEGEPSFVNAPGYVSRRVEARGVWQDVRALESVVRFPILLPGGQIATSGYVPDVRVFCDSDISDLDVPLVPSRDEAEGALSLLLEPFCDVPFADEIAVSASVSFLLTLLSRYCYDLAPLFVFDANIERTGKTLLVRSLASIALGRLPGVSSLANDEDERRKELFATALSGAPFVLFDNVSGTIKSPTLEGILTSGELNGRILGKSENRELRMRQTFAVTANNATLSNDLVKRSIPIRLSSMEERPEQRTGFRYSLPRDVQTWRLDLLRAAFTVLRFGGSGESSPIGAFEAWERVVCGPLTALGLPHPVKGQDAFLEGSDEISEPLASLLAKIKQDYPNGATASILHSDVGLKTIYSELFGSDRNMSVKALAVHFRKLRRRIVGGMFLECRRDRRLGRLWYVGENNG